MGLTKSALGRRRRLFSGLVLALLLSGCKAGGPEQLPPRTLSDQQIAQLRSDVQAIGDRCRALRLSGRGGFVGSVRCSNPGILTAYQKVDFSYMALVNLALAKRLQLAERVDAKKMSEGDMLVEFYSDVGGLPAIPTP